MPEIWLRYAWDMSEIYLRYAWDMPEICLRYALELPEICLRVSVSQSLSQSWDLNSRDGLTDWLTDWPALVLNMLSHLKSQIGDQSNVTKDNLSLEFSRQNNVEEKMKLSITVQWWAVCRCRGGWRPSATSPRTRGTSGAGACPAYRAWMVVEVPGQCTVPLSFQPE